MLEQTHQQKEHNLIDEAIKLTHTHSERERMSERKSRTNCRETANQKQKHLSSSSCT